MNDTQNKLQKASEGLLMMSESDYPFEYFSTPEQSLDKELIVKLSEKPEHTPVEIIEIEYLFRNMINTYPESGEAERNTAALFKNLITVLKAELSQLKVYRIGGVQVDVFIAGINQEGTVSGLKTRLIET